MSEDQTRILVNRWLPKIPMGHPTPLQGIYVDANQRVSSIIQLDSRGWQWEAIDGIVPEAEREVISLTNVGNSRRPDRLIWPADRRGCILSGLVIGGFLTGLNIEDLGGLSHPDLLIPWCGSVYGASMLLRRLGIFYGEGFGVHW